jgi:ribosomal protein S8
MNYSFLKLLNCYKNAVNQKRRYFNVQFSKQYLHFVEYLLDKGFISSFNLVGTGKKKAIKNLLKYEGISVPAMSNFSITSKKAHKRPAQKHLSSINEQNIIVNLTSNKGVYSVLLARFR